MRTRMIGGALLLAAAALPTHVSHASSHREAPFLTENPKVDGTDFYMFDSYEAGEPSWTPPRPRVGNLSAHAHTLPRHQRWQVTLGRLHEALSAGRQVVAQFGWQ